MIAVAAGRRATGTLAGGAAQPGHRGARGEEVAVVHGRRAGHVDGRARRGRSLREDAHDVGTGLRAHRRHRHLLVHLLDHADPHRTSASA